MAKEDGRRSLRIIRNIEKKVLDHLRQNREKHLAMHKEGMEGYCIEAADYINRLQTELHKNPEKFDHKAILKDLKRPKFYGREYNHAIKMLEWSTDKEVVIDQNQFESWVEDKWGWKREWLVLNSLHRTRAGYQVTDEEEDNDDDDAWD